MRRFGFCPTIADEWDLFEDSVNHQVQYIRICCTKQQDDQFESFEPSSLIKQAFYMGALMMLGMVKEDSSREHLIALAGEIDCHLKEHAQTCEACREADVSLVRDWFSEEEAKQ